MGRRLVAFIDVGGLWGGVCLVGRFARGGWRVRMSPGAHQHHGRSPASRSVILMPLVGPGTRRHAFGPAPQPWGEVPRGLPWRRRPPAGPERRGRPHRRDAFAERHVRRRRGRLPRVSGGGGESGRPQRRRLMPQRPRCREAWAPDCLCSFTASSATYEPAAEVRGVLLESSSQGACGWQCWRSGLVGSAASAALWPKLCLSRGGRAGSFKFGST